MPPHPSLSSSSCILLESRRLSPPPLPAAAAVGASTQATLRGAKPFHQLGLGGLLHHLQQRVLRVEGVQHIVGASEVVHALKFGVHLLPFVDHLAESLEAHEAVLAEDQRKVLGRPAAQQVVQQIATLLVLHLPPVELRAQQVGVVERLESTVKATREDHQVCCIALVEDFRLIKLLFQVIDLLVLAHGVHAQKYMQTAKHGRAVEKKFVVGNDDPRRYHFFRDGRQVLAVNRENAHLDADLKHFRHSGVHLLPVTNTELHTSGFCTLPLNCSNVAKKMALARILARLKRAWSTGSPSMLASSINVDLPVPSVPTTNAAFGRSCSANPRTVTTGGSGREHRHRLRLEILVLEHARQHRCFYIHMGLLPEVEGENALTCCTPTPALGSVAFLLVITSAATRPSTHTWYGG